MGRWDWLGRGRAVEDQEGEGRRRLWGQGMRVSVGCGYRYPVQVRPGGPRAAASSPALGAGLAGSLTSSHCGTGCGALCRCLGAREGVGEGTGASLSLGGMRWGWELVAPSPRLSPRGSLRTLLGTWGNDRSSPGTDCCWVMRDTIPVPFRKE